MKNILIINYNTPIFIEKLIISINKFVSDAHIIIFENSDKQLFKTTVFKNVEIIDNTNGNIIDFNDFLERYPKRNRSSGKNNNWASAKHCYTVELCMKLLNTDFLLLDSDIIIKKDVSELFDKNFLYASEILTQSNGIKRVAPYLCYINAPMCLQNNIHFFNDNYMHGLCKTHNSDNYDTGAYFYLAAKDFFHNEIKTDVFAVHYGHGSWSQTENFHHLTPEEFFEKYKEFIS